MKDQVTMPKKGKEGSLRIMKQEMRQVTDSI